MTMAISKAVEDGAKVVVCASTGNTSASAAAYAARAGMVARGRHPRRSRRAGQARAGAHPRREGRAGPRQLRRRARTSCASSASGGGVTVVNSINPFRIEGQKTAAFEIGDALGDAPDVHCIPVGNAGNITAYWKGYGEYERRSATRPPARGCSAGRRPAPAPLVLGEPVLHPETIATAIRIGNPATLGRRRSRPATSRAARSARSPTPRSSTRTGCSRSPEGVFVEPASAASVAGLLAGARPGTGRTRARRSCARSPVTA